MKRPVYTPDPPPAPFTMVRASIDVSTATEGELLLFCGLTEHLAGSLNASAAESRLLAAIGRGFREAVDARARGLLRWEAQMDDPARDVLMGDDGRGGDGCT